MRTFNMFDWTFAAEKILTIFDFSVYHKMAEFPFWIMDYGSIKKLLQLFSMISWAILDYQSTKALTIF